MNVNSNVFVCSRTFAIPMFPGPVPHSRQSSVPPETMFLTVLKIATEENGLTGKRIQFLLHAYYSLFQRSNLVR